MILRLHLRPRMPLNRHRIANPSPLRATARTEQNLHYFMQYNLGGDLIPDDDVYQYKDSNPDPRG